MRVMPRTSGDKTPSARLRFARPGSPGPIVNIGAKRV